MQSLADLAPHQAETAKACPGRFWRHSSGAQICGLELADARRHGAVRSL